MDQRFGGGWRLVSDGHLPLDAPVNATLIDLAQHPEGEGVVADWMQRHSARAALVRPDHYVFGTAADAAGTQALLAEWAACLNASTPERLNGPNHSAHRTLQGILHATT